MLYAFENGGVMPERTVRFSHERLARLLSERGISPYALAKQLGASQTWAQKLMAGSIRMPTDKYLFGMSELLGVSVTDLLEVGQEQEPQMIREVAPSYGLERMKQLIEAHGTGLNEQFAKQMLILLDRIPPDRHQDVIEIVEKLFIKWPRLDASPDGNKPEGTRLKG